MSGNNTKKEIDEIFFTFTQVNKTIQARLVEKNQQRNRGIFI